MSIHEGRAEQIGGVVFMVFSAILAFGIIPFQVKAVDAHWYNSPRLFPYVIAGLLFLLGGLLVVTGTRTEKKLHSQTGQDAATNEEEQETYSFAAKETKLVLITLAIVCLYVAAMNFLPYIPCTIVTLGLLMWVYGQRNWIKLASISIIFPLLIYFAFTFLLKLRLP